MDAGNMLRPMLARGELRLVGATTLDEYREHIEKDAALERRFQRLRRRAQRRGHRRPSCAGSRSATRRTTRWRSPTPRSVAAATLSTATSPAASCPTRRSTWSTSRVAAANGDRLLASRRSTRCAARSTGSRWRRWSCPADDTRLRARAGQAARRPRRPRGGAARLTARWEAEKAGPTASASCEELDALRVQAERLSREGDLDAARGSCTARSPASRSSSTLRPPGGDGRAAARCHGRTGADGQGRGRPGRRRRRRHRVDRHPRRAPARGRVPPSCCGWRRCSASD